MVGLLAGLHRILLGGDILGLLQMIVSYQDKKPLFQMTLLVDLKMLRCVLLYL